MTNVIWKAGAAAAVAVALGGCAGDPPVAQMSAARTMVTQAQPEAMRYSPQLLQAAQEKLALADAAMKKGNNDQARRLAEKAEADARLALANAEHLRSQQALAEVNQSLQALRQELERRNP